jgi:UDP-2,3-diacylglucosamine pyrophosphatase LpxH/uncharacterized membrane protein HdeD (DUF308 family)
MDGAGRDIFVISDLHLGDGGARDNFEAGRKTPDLRAFVDHVGAEGGELLVLGDLFELWQMNLSLLFVKRRELLDHLASVDLAYVPGNHDVDLLHFIGTDLLAHPFFARMRAPFVRAIGGRRFRFCHGHETDPFNAGDDPGFGRMLAIFGGVFEDENGSPFLASGESVEDVLEQFGESMLTIWRCAMATITKRVTKEEVHPKAALTPAQNPDRLAEHVAGVRADLAKGGHDVVVLGHTHKAGRIGDWYFNSGSWTGPTNHFLRISPDGDVRHFEWKEGRPVERAMPVVAPDAEPAREAPPQNPFRAAAAAARTLFPKPTKPEPARLILIAQGALALAVGAFALTISIGQGATAGWRVLVTAFGIYALLDGAISLAGASREPPMKRLLSRVRGAAGLLLGLVVLRRGYAAEIFVVLAGLWAFLSGALRVAASVVFKGMVDARWLFLVGVGSMLAGLVLLLWPTSGPLLKYVLSGYLCYYGLGELLAGIFGQRLSRLRGKATSIAAVLVLALGAGCGVAQRAGRGAAAGAMGTLAEKLGDAERVEQLAEGVKRRAVGGALEEIARPERLGGVQRIGSALGAGVVAGASREASGLPEAGVGGAGATPVEAMSALAARALSQQLAAELGSGGEGPLGASLSATAGQMTASMARGAHDELAPLFPECRGADASSCLDRAVERVSRASAAGVSQGIRASLGIWPLVFSFGLGAFSMLALGWAWAIYRARGAARAP